MMNYINITVRGKIARAEGRARIVCGNSDYAVRFDFDEEWEAYELKTARFITEGGFFTDVQFTGSDCAVPVLTGTRTLLVGVFAGNLRTTTAALIHAVPCITDPDGTPADPTPDVYSQLMERFNAMEAPAAVLYAEQELTEEQKRQARANIKATGSEQFTVVNEYNEIASCGATSGVCRGGMAGTPAGLTFPAFFLFSDEHYGKRKVTMLDGAGQFWDGLANASEIQNMTIVRTIPDWNQNDKTAADYIKNRPFYRKKLYHYTWDGTRNATEDIDWYYPYPSTCGCLHFISSETPPMSGRFKWGDFSNSNREDLIWRDVNENEGEFSAQRTEFGWIQPSPVSTDIPALAVVTTPTASLPCKGIYFGGYYDPRYHTNYNYGWCAEYEMGGEYQTIAPEYLPLDIQGDWNQNDENAIDHVRNRPYYYTEPPVHVAWDGMRGEGDPYYSSSGSTRFHVHRVSDDTPPMKGRFRWSSSTATSGWFEIGDSNAQTTDYGWVQLGGIYPQVLVVTTPTQQFPHTGLYFGGILSSLTSDQYDSFCSEFEFEGSAQKLPPEFLPEKCIIELAWDDDGNVQADKTFEEIQAAYGAGQTIVLRFYELDFALSYATLDGGFSFNISYIGFDQWVRISPSGVEISGQTFLPTASDDEPLPSGTASAGSDEAYARADHVHPIDTLAVSVKKSDGQYQFVTGSYADIEAAVAIGRPVFLRLIFDGSYGDKFHTYICWRQLDTPGKSGQYYFRLLDARYATTIHTIVICSDTDIRGEQDTSKEIVLWSSTTGSSKKFKLTVDDSGAVTATEITD